MPPFAVCCVYDTRDMYLPLIELPLESLVASRYIVALLVSRERYKIVQNDK
jgi:hypothetical protein